MLMYLFIPWNASLAVRTCSCKTHSLLTIFQFAQFPAAWEQVEPHRRSSSASDARNARLAPWQPRQSQQQASALEQSPASEQAAAFEQNAASYHTSAVSSPGGPPLPDRPSPATSAPSQASRQPSIRSLFSRVGSIGQLLGAAAVPSPQVRIPGASLFWSAVAAYRSGLALI